MLSILDVNPKITGTPKQALKLAVDQLKAAAEGIVNLEAQRLAHQTEADRIRNRYVSRVLPRPSVTSFKTAIEASIAGKYGKLKGPSQNALNELDYFAKRAEKAGYPLNSTQVQDAFLSFLMAYVTEGFEDKDTTGTQMGNFKRGWAGGGFKD